jgi:succinate dehydrogenase/fumarate reductase flavoprotein subunit
MAPDELLLAAQRVEAAMEALIDALMAAGSGLQQAEAARIHNALDRVYSEHPAIVRESLEAHDAWNSVEETKR